MVHRDLSSLRLRRLTPAEQALYTDFLLSLDRETRRNRFSGTVSDEFIFRHVDSAFARSAIIHVCERDDIVIGASELHPAADGVAEAAFAVAPQHRNQGVGHRLLKAVLNTASDRGDRVIRVRCLRTNAAMRRLAQKAKADMTITLDEVEGDITPPPPARLLRRFLRRAGERVRAFAPLRPGPGGRVARSQC